MSKLRVIRSVVFTTSIVLAAALRVDAQAIPVARADVNGDCAVTTVDVNLVRGAVGARCGQSRYRQEYDVNRDCNINNTDLTFVTRNLGASVCAPPPVLPTISASVSPAANANGWHNAAVTITYTCVNASACPAPVTLSTEGANQVVERSVTGPGGTATSRVTLNIDRTPPQPTVTAPVSARAGTALQVEVAASDLSGTALVELFDNAAPAGTDTTSPFTFVYSVPAAAAEGTGRQMFARVTDRAGNSGSALATITVTRPDTLAPTVTIAVPAVGAPSGLVPVVVTARDDRALASLVLTNDGAALAQATSEPFTFQYNAQLPSTPGGRLTLLATATDAEGNLSTASATVVAATTDPSSSEPLLVTVDPPVSPTFQTSTVLTGTIGPGTPRPPATRAFIASISPLAARQGQVLDVAIAGASTQFANGESAVTFGPGIVVQSLTVTSPTQMTARIAVERSAGVGPRVVVATTGNQEAALINAFTVQTGTTTVTGRVLNQQGQAVANARVCVPGTTLCATTDATGRFALAGAPIDARRVTVQADGYLNANMPVGLTVDAAEQIGDIALAADNVPPPPPPPNSPPVAPRLAVALGRGASDISSGPQNFDAVMRMVEDAIVAAGGSEIGVLDAAGQQLNPLVTGDGFWTYRHMGVESMAQRMIAGDVRTLGETLGMLLLSYRYPSRDAVPSLPRVILGLQQEVNAAWADPARPGAALIMLLFNQGRTVSATPPTLSIGTLLNEVQTQMLVSSFLTFIHRRYVAPASSATAWLERPAPAAGLARASTGPPAAARAEGGAVSGRPRGGSLVVRLRSWAGQLAAFLPAPTERLTASSSRAAAHAAIGAHRAPAGRDVDGRSGLERRIRASRTAEQGAPAPLPFEPNANASLTWGSVWNVTLGAMGEQGQAKLPGVYAKLCDVAVNYLPGGSAAVVGAPTPPAPAATATSQIGAGIFYKPGCPEVVKLMNVLLRNGVQNVMESDRNFFDFFEREGVPRSLAARVKDGLATGRLDPTAAFKELAEGEVESLAATVARKRAFKENIDVTWGAWAEAQAEAKRRNLQLKVAQVAGGYVETVLSKQQGAAVKSIFKIQTDLIIQSLRPRPPEPLSAVQVVDPQTAERYQAVVVTFKVSDNDRMDQHDPSTKWHYEFWRVNGGRGHEMLDVRHFEGVKRTRQFTDLEPPLGTSGYYLIARRRIGGPIEYAPTTFDSAIAPMLEPLVPSGLSMPDGPYASPSSKFVTKSFSFDTLKTVLDPAATILKGVAYQVSDPSDTVVVSVTLRTAPAPVGALAIDPGDRQEYLSLPNPVFQGTLFKLRPGVAPFTQTGFLLSPEGTQAGLAVDSLGYVYTNNVASNARFGGRIFRYDSQTGAREHVGAVNYFSVLLQHANPASVQALAIGPGVNGETLYIADSLNQRITTMMLPQQFGPGMYAGRNTSQVRYESPLFNFINSAMTVRHDTVVFVNQGDNILKVPSALTPAGIVTAARPLFRPGTSLFTQTTGITSDLYGNLYVSDINGTITMLPSIKITPTNTGDGISPLERKLFTLARGLSRPTDVKLMGNRQGLAFFDAERPFAELPFGFSAQVVDTAGRPVSGALVVLPDDGRTERTDSDGVVVLSGIMKRGRSSEVKYSIRYEGRVSSGILSLNPFQHNVVELTFEPEPEAPSATQVRVPLRQRGSNLPPPPQPSVINVTGPTVTFVARAVLPGIESAPENTPPPPAEPESRCPSAHFYEPGDRIVVASPLIDVRALVSDPTLGVVGLLVNAVRTEVPLLGREFTAPVTLQEGANRLAIVVRAQVLREGQCAIDTRPDDEDVVISKPVEVFYSASQTQRDAYRASLGYDTALRGIVLDSITNAPVVGLPVSIVGTSVQGTTDRFGAFQLNVSLPDFRPALTHADETAEALTASIASLAGYLRAGDEGPAQLAMSQVLLTLEQAKFSRQPIAASTVRPMLETLEGIESRLFVIYDALQGLRPDYSPDDLTALEVAVQQFAQLRNANAIEISSEYMPALSILIRAAP